ncbi:zinc finger Y-chromosomal protein 1-like [Tropilaelaps mercedesae]|uniref:Zinc finger Y-chromosomal protein 1-like n=1 Tax=Tropilaelaps mercedesae TaxID=418985 RepID=A0A1V9XZU4_9ACAR|nr:zinc finger Y-chromosomal protein 1-like [Tropilaelaps mercedesae]
MEVNLADQLPGACGLLAQKRVGSEQIQHDSRFGYAFYDGLDVLQRGKARSDSVDSSRRSGGDSSGVYGTPSSTPTSGDVELLKLDLWQHLQRSTLWGLSQKGFSSLSELSAASADSVMGPSTASGLPYARTTPSTGLGFHPFDLVEPASASVAGGHGARGGAHMPPGSGGANAGGGARESVGVNEAIVSCSSGASPSVWHSLLTTSASRPNVGGASYSCAPPAAANPAAGPSSGTGLNPMGGVSMSLTCYNCGLGTTTRKNLARHIRSCLGYRPHHCPLCPYAASRRDNLRRHLAIHKDMPNLEAATLAAGGTRDENARHGTLAGAGKAASATQDFGTPPAGSVAASPAVASARANNDEARATDEEQLMKDDGPRLWSFPSMASSTIIDVVTSSISRSVHRLPPCEDVVRQTSPSILSDTCAFEQMDGLGRREVRNGEAAFRFVKVSWRRLALFVLCWQSGRFSAPQNESHLSSTLTSHLRHLCSVLTQFSFETRAPFCSANFILLVDYARCLSGVAFVHVPVSRSVVSAIDDNKNVDPDPMNVCLELLDLRGCLPMKNALKKFLGILQRLQRNVAFGGWHFSVGCISANAEANLTPSKSAALVASAASAFRPPSTSAGLTPAAITAMATASGGVAVGAPGLSNYISCNGYDRFIQSDAEGNNRCLICNYSVKHRRNIYRHILTHTGDKPFKCELCGFKSSRSDKLKHHIKTKHFQDCAVTPAGIVMSDRAATASVIQGGFRNIDSLVNVGSIAGLSSREGRTEAT